MMKMQETLYSNPDVYSEDEVKSVCLADLISILDSISDHEIIDKNHGWFVKEIMRKRLKGMSIRAIAIEYGIPQTTFRKQVKGFENYIINKLDEL